MSTRAPKLVALANRRRLALSERNVTMKHLSSIATIIAAALLSGAAAAADLPSNKAPPQAPPAPQLPWTGIYVGANLGYGWGDQNSFSGVVGGGQVGYNYQFTPLFVASIEADIQGASLSSAGQGYAQPGRSIDYFGTVRGRVGITPFDPRLLIFGTGGFAYSQVRYNGGAINTNRPGWTAGGGVEWLVTPAWSVKLEYLYTDISTEDLGSWPYQGLGKTKFSTVRAGVNYHFDLFPPAPFLARR
jgi:outer membrane immunogenic protein